MTSTLDQSLAAMGYAKAIVVFKKSVSATLKSPAVPDDLARHFVIPDTMLESDLARAAASHSSGEAVATAVGPAVRIYPRLGLALGYVDRQGAKELRSDSRVKKLVEAPQISLIRPVIMEDAKPNSKPTSKPTWGIERLGVPELWSRGITGKGVIVGHLDTGVDGSHSALKDAIEAFAEFDLRGDLVENAEVRDSDDHGTHTAGTIVGRKTERGSFGVAPGAKLASAMVIEGGDVVDRIVGGMEWALGYGVRILSMSLGLRGYTPAFQAIVDALRANDVLPVIAVGNEYANSSRSPGNYTNVLSVGASNERDEVADFSSSQRFNRTDDPIVPDLVAPGVNVLSCVPNGGYMTMDGSSMATPHVAGLAALLLQAMPSATSNDLEHAILASCGRPSSMPIPRGNRGIPNAPKALSILAGTNIQPTV
ncbi:S8 family peptidase [Azospirillum lipoferum]|uniref:Subtilisin n=1 Tax=Azospirillum lipoferum (strain 4B) TaxID=862719 RepID=G7ZDZ6_AZOL4|nr:S8 family serine peptidase [Azospirillum lipoferum]CBS89844.1 putative Subtilisin [Azospirillum lipoferum 4B]